ncbi:MAG: flagellar hook basal-body protein [Candidatus Gastranaerophilales bacterium]|nr:flagellar hook basal-body protein [Candidatus Gastranaerophilales bacterium]
MMFNAQAIVRKSINNATTQFDKLGYVANDLANYNNYGYKSVRFEQMLREDGYVAGAQRCDCAQGAVRITENPYDVAIKGPGYIPVTSEDGEVQYTRDGSFVKGKDGYLYTKDGWLVGGGIQLPANNYKFTINPNGNVYTYDEAGSAPKLVGTIPLVGFANPERLEQGVNNKMRVTDESGDPELISDHRSFRQHSIEASNVNIYASVNEMLRLNASMIASMRLLKVADDMYNKGINIRE